jgi:V/A-type H+-transporting ATPase subunit D
MAKVKLTKTELKAQTDALKRFQRFLPMLLLKKQQLQGEIAGIIAKVEEVSAREDALKNEMGRWVALLSSDPDLVGGLVKVKSVKTSLSNIAGVEIPTFVSIDTQVKEIDPWQTPAWVDDAVSSTTEILALKCQRAVYEEQLRLVSIELKLTSQRVNLFEKVKIPECKEAIRVIKIALGDQQTAAVTRGKIAKSRSQSPVDGEEGA